MKKKKNAEQREEKEQQEMNVRMKKRDDGSSWFAGISSGFALVRNGRGRSSILLCSCHSQA